MKGSVAISALIVLVVALVAPLVGSTHIDLAKKGSDGSAVYDLAPGEYRIVCKVPGHSSMNSTLTVG